jgi:hypothetical protein
MSERNSERTWQDLRSSRRSIANSNPRVKLLIKDLKNKVREQLNRGEVLMLKRLAATASVLAMLSGAAVAEPVKVGMITTLSGGGAGLGIDVRDGFPACCETGRQLRSGSDR